MSFEKKWTLYMDGLIFANCSCANISLYDVGTDTNSPSADQSEQATDTYFIWRDDTFSCMNGYSSLTGRSIDQRARALFDLISPTLRSVILRIITAVNPIAIAPNFSLSE